MVGEELDGEGVEVAVAYGHQPRLAGARLVAEEVNGRERVDVLASLEDADAPTS